MSRPGPSPKTPQPMPGHVRAALDKRDLLEAFRARPRYQQDDYLKWLALAVGEVAKKARLAQMLDELAAGDKFKGEPWTPPPPVARATAPGPR